jgi:hypothetical protein
VQFKKGLIDMDLGLQKFLKDIRYHRERFRQFIGISFVMLVSIAGYSDKTVGIRAYQKKQNTCH